MAEGVIRLNAAWLSPVPQDAILPMGECFGVSMRDGGEGAIENIRSRSLQADNLRRETEGSNSEEHSSSENLGRMKRLSGSGDFSR
jgi:hypothetical protein